MAARKTTRSRAVVLKVEDGRCGCGCGAEVARTFKQGHDARLKGILGRAHKGGQQVTIVSNGTRTSTGAQELLEARGWPVPAVPAPKAKATTTKPKAGSARIRKAKTEAAA
jgi:hypothetical protein